MSFTKRYWRRIREPFSSPERNSAGDAVSASYEASKGVSSVSENSQGTSNVSRSGFCTLVDAEAAESWSGYDS